MRTAVFNTKGYDRESFDSVNGAFGHDLVFFKPHLSKETVPLAHGFPAVCAFVNDDLSAEVLQDLADNGTKLIALRCSGFNQVNIVKAHELGMTVLRVPAYSPQGVAEHAVAMIMALNRKIHVAHNRVRDGNFSLEGLIGFEVAGKTVGVVGTGQIGRIFARIMKQGFGANVIAYDVFQHPECAQMGIKYVGLDEIYKQSDIISLHCPLMTETYHLIHDRAVSLMKKGVMLINTSRGGLVDTKAVIKGLKQEKIGAMGLDVYEEEAALFFEDHSGHIIQDDVFARLLTFPNVMITSHQAFLTRNALANIAETTLQNITDYEKGSVKQHNEVKLSQV